MPIQRWSTHIWVAQLAHDPAFTEDMETLLEQAEAANPIPHIVLDLSGVEHINSSNLSQMLRLRKQMIDGDAQLRLAGPPDHVWALLLATGLDKVFHFTHDTSTALADLQME